MLSNIKEELSKIDEELSKYNTKMESLEKRAASYASKVLLFGVSMAAAQLGGFTYLIYGLYTWDDMEPLTYLVGAFYAWVSMLFWFRYKEDWEWSNARNAFFTKRLTKLMEQNSVDQERIKFLENYRDLLKVQLAHIES